MHVLCQLRKPEMVTSYYGKRFRYDRVEIMPTQCPSARCKTGSNLLGIVERTGRVTFLNQKTVVTKEFVQIAQRGRAPEKRFRFSNACITSACRQWTGEKCGVIEQVLRIIPPDQRCMELPECTIRPNCRWFQQHGATACSVCPFVITDAMVCDQEGDYYDQREEHGK